MREREGDRDKDGEAQVHKGEKKFVQKDVGAGLISGLWINHVVEGAAMV